MGSRAALLAFAFIACGDNGQDSELRQGGDTTVDDRTNNAFLHSAANLTSADQMTFATGLSPFDFHWEIPQLGPLYNNDSCFGCHASNGRGEAQIGPDGAITDLNGPQSESLVRVSLMDGSADPTNPGGPIPLPGIGTQLRDHATVGLPDAITTLSFTEQTITYPDGNMVSLRTPVLDIRPGNGSAFPDDTMYSYRIAPPLIGLGLLAAVDPTAAADPNDADGDGISGALNMVWDPVQQMTVVGRFGWKENTSTLETQAANAAFHDMGLANEVFPNDDGTTDMPDDQFEPLEFMIGAIGVPAAASRDSTAQHGRDLFDSFGCSGCHTVTQVTGDSPIAECAHQTIHPYTDLLLHDMGSGLADNRPDFLASGSQWRTPALWAIGLAQVVTPEVTFLHDGRARTFEEAIMWHGGEAQAAHDAFMNADASDRAALTAFLGTL
jgi:CxxC motif-containing protein (DUF1111 family)